MNLKMKTLAAAMIAAGTMGAAQASSILFPYVVNSTTVTTIVSVIDVNSGSNQLHWALWYKDGAKAEDNSATCSEVDQWLPSSTHDIQTVDLGGKFGSTTKGVLFNDPSINNNWKASNKRFDMANLASKPLRGYLIVDDETYGSGEGGTGRTNLEGEAMVLEFASGATWGYTAGRSTRTNFTTDADINVTSPQNVSIKPWGEIVTKYLVTPIDDNMLDGNNNRKAVLEMKRDGVAMYDRDENPVSGSVKQSVVCVGAVEASTLITASAKSLLPDGGWGTLNVKTFNTATGAPDVQYTTSASVIKLDYNSGAKLNGETVTGTFNNAFQLR
jgi:hypothetical protein